MFKKFKKISVFTLVLLLLFSVIPMQSFAILGFDKIDKIDVKSCEEFSLKQINDYVAEFEGEEMDEEDNQYPLYCDLDVTISTGEVISVKDSDYGFSKNEKRVVDSYAWVKVDECLKAAEEGKNTVPLYIEVYLYSSIDVELDKKLIVKEITFADRFVDSLTLVEGEIRFYKHGKTYGDYGYFEYIFAGEDGLTFDIEYSDGRKVRAALDKELTKYGEYYTLDGNEVNIYIDDDNEKICAIVEFMDISITSPVTVLPYPITDVKIDDATFDENFIEKTLTFTVTKADGSTETVNYEFPVKENVESMIIRTYDTIYVEGIPFDISVLTYSADEYPPYTYNRVVISSHYFGVTKDFQGPQMEDTLINRIIYKLTQFIAKILLLFL